MHHMTTSNFSAQPAHMSFKGGILVAHAWWGLTPFFKHFCQRLADEGFYVLAPDLYHGATAASIEEAETLSSSLKKRLAVQQLNDAAAELRTAAGVEQIGMIGFSLGAYLGMILAQKQPSIAAFVAFYGATTGDFSQSRAAYQFHFAHPDPYLSDSTIKKLERSLRTAEITAEYFHYHACGHWFFESNQPAYHPASANLAWERALSFLNSHLAHP